MLGFFSSHIKPIRHTLHIRDIFDNTTLYLHEKEKIKSMQKLHVTRPKVALVKVKLAPWSAGTLTYF